jgi:hypothetical protein
MKAITQLTLALSFLCGLLWYAWQAEYILFRIPFKTVNSYAGNKKDVVVYRYQQNNWEHDARTIVATTDSQTTLRHLITTWTYYVHDAGLLNEKAHIDDVLISTDNTAYVSWTASPFTLQASTLEKWMLIKSLCMTIDKNMPGILAMQFLLNHTSLHDPQIATLLTLPIKKIALNQ